MLFGKIDTKKNHRKCIWLQLYWHIGFFHIQKQQQQKNYKLKLWMKQRETKNESFVVFNS